MKRFGDVTIVKWQKMIMIVIGILISYLLINITLTAHAGDPGTWQVVLQTTISHPTNVVGFLDETFGITVGPSGEVHYTIDGGKTWPRANNISWCRYGLDIVNDSVAWNVGNAGQVRVSTDGGRNWQAEPVPTTLGALFLTHDGTMLTAFLVNRATVLRYQ